MDGLIGVLNDVGHSWAAVMWAALWQSTILAGGILALGRFFKKMPPSMRYWLWMFVGLRLIVMPFYSVELPVFTETPLPTVLEQAGEKSGGPMNGTPVLVSEFGFRATEGRDTVASSRTASAPAESPGSQAPSLHYTALLMLLWSCGLVAVLGRMGFVYYRTHRIVAQAQFENARLSALAFQASRLLGLRKHPLVGITDESVSPFVVGVWNPVVILPRALFTQQDDEKILVVLAHEFAHIRRRDPLLGWAFALCHALYFFHPALPFVKRQLLLERERACDDWVLAVSRARPSVYARTLVAVAALCSPSLQHTGPALVVGESFQDLKKRLEYLRDDGKPRPRVSPLSAAMLLLGALVVAPGVIFGTVAVEASPAPPSPTIAATPSAALIMAVHHEAATTTTGATVEGRVLSFPKDRTVGMLKVKDGSIAHHIDTYFFWTDDEDWKDLAPATGEVVIPEGQRVWLMLNGEACTDMSFLEALRPSDIYRLSTMYTEAGEPGLSDDDMAYVAHLTGLRALELTYTDIGARGLAYTSALTHLERLWIPRGADDTAMMYVGQLTSLKGLYFREHNVSDAGLYQVRNLQNLREISLGNGRMSDRGLQELTSLPRLEYLFLSSNHFGDAGMAHVARIPALRTLKLQGPQLTDRGVEALCQSENLERLALYGMTEMTGQALRNLKNLSALKMLDLGAQPGEATRVDDYSMAYVAECTSLERLRPPGEITDAGLAHLETLPRLKHLQIYRRKGGSITDAGLQSIAKIESLESLCVQGDDVVTDDGMAAVASLRKLTSLIFGTQSSYVTDRGLAAFSGLNQLTYLDLNFNKRSAVSLSALTDLNVLTELETLLVYGIQQDDSVLDLAPLHNLENVSINISGGVRDEDMVCLAGLKKLRWLQGIEGISDAGVAHIANLDQLDRIFFRGDQITDTGLEILGGLPKMNSLSVEGNFTSEGLKTLERLQGLQNLRIGSKTPLDEEALEELVRSMPNLLALNGATIGAGAGSTINGRGGAVRASR